MFESALYPAVKRFLAARGYDVKGEVAGCDVVGIKPGEPEIVVITEMKLGLTLDLLLQAVDRLPCADEVWLAVPATRRGRDRDPRARKLCRLLGFGLLAVGADGDAAPLAEPTAYHPRPNLRRRRLITAEHRRRRGDPSPGGTRGVPIMTAYRQEALAWGAPPPASATALGRPRRSPAPAPAHGPLFTATCMAGSNGSATASTPSPRTGFRPWSSLRPRNLNALVHRHGPYPLGPGP